MSTTKSLGKYNVIENIGRGGFATVVKARNTSLGNIVALKLLSPALTEDATFLQRFRLEAQRVATLDHPHIVKVFDLDEANGQHFIIMEFVPPGRDLRQVMDSEKELPLPRIVEIMRQIGSALDYAHSRELVHRDVKPSNILIREDGVAKLSDFGIVKAVEGTPITQSGSTLGTPAYMSPEQAKGIRLDGRSDIYSLGVVAFELVTGQVPFKGDNSISTGIKHINELPPRPSDISPRARNPVEAVLLKALAKKPDERYQTGAELAEALATAVTQLEQQVVADLYREGKNLVNAQRFAEAVPVLENVRQIQPGYRDTVALLQQARQGQETLALYQQLASAVMDARQQAEAIQKAAPGFQDSAGVLAMLLGNGRSAPKQTLTPGLLWFLGGTLVGGALLFGSMYGMWETYRRGSVYGIGNFFAFNQTQYEVYGLLVTLLGTAVLWLAASRIKKLQPWHGALQVIVVISGFALTLINVGVFNLEASTGFQLMYTGFGILIVAALPTAVATIRHLRQQRSA